MDETIPNHDDIVEIDGTRYRKVDSGYTIREYYSHSTEKGPGPGWDSRQNLLDPEYSRRKFGKTFSEDQVHDPSSLPDDPVFYLEEIE